MDNLFDAVNARVLARVDALIRAGADVNEATTDGCTPLHLAAAWGSLHIARALMTAGASVGAADAYGRTALDFAICADRPAMVDELIAAGAPAHLCRSVTKFMAQLIAAGADVNAPIDYGLTPLHWAASYSDIAAVKILLDAGANADANFRTGQTPLYRACFCCSPVNLEVIDALINAGADIAKVWAKLPADRVRWAMRRTWILVMLLTK